jgi:biopolymer transport protein ExbB
MRKLTVLLIVLPIFFGMNAVGAEELSDAYMKEYTFLKAQKEELVKRLGNEQKQQQIEITAARNTVRNLQDKYVGLSRELKEKEQSIENARDTFRDISSNEEIINSVIIRAKMALERYGVWVDDEAVSQVDMMAHAFTAAANLYNTLSSIRIRDGEFYLMDGTIARGEIVEVGNIAAYGISTKVKGALAPAGNGEYKIWNQLGSHDDAQALYDKQLPETLDIFIYENRDKDVEYQKEKTFQDVIEGGGIIGYVILGLGILGLFLLLARALFLLRAGSRVKRIPELVYEKIESGRVSEAYEAIKDFKGSTARVIRATLRNITSERDHIEDIITESILNENRALDRFGSFILVIAAVSPLLGLLGTVTGMISTFDVITIYGTGDPKLLSGGISEALVTTMLGLFVAIPLILLGNLANGWAENIKGSMEQSALHVVNLHEKYAAAK